MRVVQKSINNNAIVLRFTPRADGCLPDLYEKLDLVAGTMIPASDKEGVVIPGPDAVLSVIVNYVFRMACYRKVPLTTVVLYNKIRQVLQMKRVGEAGRIPSGVLSQTPKTSITLCTLCAICLPCHSPPSSSLTSHNCCMNSRFIRVHDYVGVYAKRHG